VLETTGSAARTGIVSGVLAMGVVGPLLGGIPIARDFGVGSTS
jgi:hypothetical protein